MKIREFDGPNTTGVDSWQNSKPSRWENKCCQFVCDKIKKIIIYIKILIDHFICNLNDFLRIKYESKKI